MTSHNYRREQQNKGFYPERTKMTFFRKAFLFLRREGFRNTFIRTVQKIWEQIRRIPGNMAEHLFSDYYSKILKNHICGKQVYILMASIDWKIPLFQRPHQIALALSRRENTHVLFISEKQRYDYFAGLISVDDNLDVVSEGLTKVLSGILREAAHVTVFKSWPRHAKQLEQIPYDTLVYEYIDDISLFYYYTDEMKKKHYDLIRNANLTVCTAGALYEDALPLAQKAILSPNAGDYAFFCNNRSAAVDPALAQMIQKYECVLGYYGCLASWFDYDLILQVAQKMPQWCFVLVGYCFDGTASRLQKEARENIIIFPAMPYEKLPSFVSAFDIQMIPFVINEITKATSPVKLFEYMATGKPILTSRLPECKRYQSVTLYNDAEDFINKARQLLSVPKNSDYYAIMDKEAKENTWDARVSEILAAIEEERPSCASIS